MTAVGSTGARICSLLPSATYARPALRIADGIVQLAFLIHPDLTAGAPQFPYIELTSGPAHASATSSITE
jgi:hypothetical protein